jgi:Spx/MgsR family transcriptional regulator
MMRAMKTIHLYGIPNCDTVKKARDWLTAHGVDYVFHDFKKQGVPADLLPAWLQAVGRDTLINRKGPTWRNLGPQVHATVVDDPSAIAVMMEHSSVIKRPLVVWADGTVTVGFKPEFFAQRLAQS